MTNVDVPLYRWNVFRAVRMHQVRSNCSSGLSKSLRRLA